MLERHSVAGGILQRSVTSLDSKGPEYWWPCTTILNLKWWKEELWSLLRSGIRQEYMKQKEHKAELFPKHTLKKNQNNKPLKQHPAKATKILVQRARGPIRGTIMGRWKKWWTCQHTLLTQEGLHPASGDWNWSSEQLPVLQVFR